MLSNWNILIKNHQLKSPDTPNKNTLFTGTFLDTKDPDRTIKSIGVSTLQPLQEISEFGENYMVLLQNLASPICLDSFNKLIALKLADDLIKSQAENPILPQFEPDEKIVAGTK